MTMPKIYIAAPLFSEAEKQYNLKVDEMLQDAGFDTFLPQEDGLELSKGAHPSEIFRFDCEKIDDCDIFLFILDGRVPDEGACFELGYAHAKGKPCIGLKTDGRTTFMDAVLNPMLYYAFDNINGKTMLTSTMDSIIAMIDMVKERDGIE